MMIRKSGLFLLFLLSALSVVAQKQTFVEQLEEDVPGQGCINIECDARLDSLIGHCVEDTEAGQIKAIGYRIQVFAGNNTREARSKAQEAETYIKINYPEFPVYTVFKSPRWLCTVGDFLHYEEAYDVMRTLKKDTPYKGVIILRNQEINLKF